jgi:hypothetical protein
MRGQSALGGWRRMSWMVVTIATIPLTLAALSIVLRLATPAKAQRPMGSYSVIC